MTITSQGSSRSADQMRRRAATLQAGIAFAPGAAQPLACGKRADPNALATAATLDGTRDRGSTRRIPARTGEAASESTLHQLIRNRAAERAGFVVASGAERASSQRRLVCRWR